MSDSSVPGSRAGAGVSIRRVEADELYFAALKTRHPKYPVDRVAVAGFYKMRWPGKNDPWCPVKIVELCPTDDETGELVGDVKWECSVNGQVVSTEQVWPYCGRSPITAEAYRDMMPDAFEVSVPIPPAPPPPAPPPLSPSIERPAMEAMPKEVAEAVNHVMSNVGYVQKRGENKFHNYKFAAIGDVLGKLQPAMADAGLVVVQDEVSHALLAGDSLMSATYAFALLHKSGATWTYSARHTGLATAKNTKGGFDDKALNKCHTAARKYFLMALFQIPTGEQDDPDSQEDQPTAAPAAAQPKMTPLEWAMAAEKQVRACATADELNAWHRDNGKALAKLAEVEPETHATLTGVIHHCLDQLNPLAA